MGAADTWHLEEAAQADHGKMISAHMFGGSKIKSRQFAEYLEIVSAISL